MKHIISFSGGIGTYMVLKRVLKIAPKEDIILIFCDTKFEDDDLYRFNEDIKAKFGVEVITLCDGRNPLECADEEKFIYNSRIAGCSRYLKGVPFKKWLKENYSSDQCVLYFGIDWSESHRKENIQKRYSKYNVQFPLCEPQYLYKLEMLGECKKDGIAIPYLYKLGFSHNNCGGRCIKGGIGHYKLLYEKLPNRFKEMEDWENYMREKYNINNSILRRNNKPFLLSALRTIIEKTPEQLSLFECNDIGGCGCFIEID